MSVVVKIGEISEVKSSNCVFQKVASYLSWIWVFFGIRGTVIWKDKRLPSKCLCWQTLPNSTYILIAGKGYSKEQLSFKAKGANDRKGAIYNRLRSGTLLIPETLNETATDASKDETSRLYIFLRTVFQPDS